ncbi:MAG: B12-binding domain-containing radical SAM protein [Nitrospinae bacterium]|nr:B12-binding domain-containing radical SAM protein [Nitrospinota bacterium]MBI3813122.1 B12-binding domain-containing radical SAM protein [Nitrospinota bacterium]
MRDKKILFVLPESSKLGNWNSPKPNRGTFELHLGFLWMAAYLIKDGWKVQILDCRWQDYKSFDYGDVLFVGISTVTGVQILNGLEVARHVRKMNPEIPLVWGGPHPTIMPEQTLKNELVDIIVIGEGEKTVSELANFFSGQGKLESILGIGYKKDGNIFINPHRPFLDMDEIDFLPYDIFDADKYGFYDAIPYHSSRGCPYECTFCHNRVVNKRSWRRQSTERLLDIMGKWIAVYRPKYVNFYEDEFSIDRKRLEKICQGFIDRNFNVRWYATGRMNTFSQYDDELLILLKKSGVERIAFGVESGSEKVLQHIKKQITIDNIFETVDKCKKFDIVPVISFIIGFPSEDREDRRKTIKIINELKRIYPLADINGVFLYTPYPGTQTFEEAVKHGLQSPKCLEEWGDFIFSGNKKYYPWLKRREYLRLFTIFQTSRMLSTYANYKIGDILKRVKSDIIKYICKPKVKAIESHSSSSTYQIKMVGKMGYWEIRRKYLFDLFAYIFRAVYFIIARLRWKLSFFGYFVDIWFYEFVRKKILKLRTGFPI